MAKKKDGSLPSGQVPTLTIDGSKLISQSTAIIRFVGKYGKGDLYPSDPFQAAQVCLLCFEDAVLTICICTYII